MLKNLLSIFLCLFVLSNQALFASGTRQLESRNHVADALLRPTAEVLSAPETDASEVVVSDAIPNSSNLSMEKASTTTAASKATSAKPVRAKSTHAYDKKTTAQTTLATKHQQEKPVKMNVFQAIKAVKAIKKMQHTQNLKVSKPMDNTKLLIAWVLLTLIGFVGLFAIHRIIMGTKPIMALWYFLLCLVIVGVLIIFVDWIMMIVDLVTGSDHFSGNNKVLAWI